MMKLLDLVIHPLFASRLTELRAHPPQSMLLTGQTGVGLHTIAASIAEKHLLADITPEDKKGNYSSTATISIEKIRSLYDITRGKHAQPHFVIIDDADQMTEAAQNALLKLLEEPGANIHFILTSHTPKQLLPTILSRLIAIDVPPITVDQTTRLIKNLSISDTSTAAQLRFVAEGLPAEIIRLSSNQSRLNDLRKSMGEAREFLAGSSYHKLRIITHHQASREAALQFVDSVQRLLAHSTMSDADTSTLHLLNRSLDVYEQLLTNRNVKLQLLRLVV